MNFHHKLIWYYMLLYLLTHERLKDMDSYSTYFWNLNQWILKMDSVCPARSLLRQDAGHVSKHDFNKHDDTVTLDEWSAQYIYVYHITQVYIIKHVVQKLHLYNCLILHSAPILDLHQLLPHSLFKNKNMCFHQVSKIGWQCMRSSGK